MPDDAQQGLARAVGGDSLENLPAVAWAIHGKICEQYGLDACAKSSREKARGAVKVDKEDESTPWLLAVLEH